MYAVLSRTNDECSCCNRLWSTYKEADDYRKTVEFRVGCFMYIIKIEMGEVGKDI